MSSASNMANLNKTSSLTQVSEPMLEGLTSFISPALILDCFYNDTLDIYLFVVTSHYLNTYTRNFTLWNWEISQNEYCIVIQNVSDFLSKKNPFLDFFQLLADTNLFDVSSSISEEIHVLTPPKTEPYGLIEMFPKHTRTLEIFEVISINIDNSLYDFIHLPSTKLYYPEPFIASPSFNHEQLWFIHILHYQHWLWFFFISLVMLFFITFINTVHACNPRKRPKRETRGVSRSKCADLITACVPVSWAISILISESVDATDYYDGFGTGEIVVGIRAYQWGWEYFFPKNIDLNYSVNPTYAAVTGNSLKYSRASEKTEALGHTWKTARLANNPKLTSAPAHILLSPSENKSISNFINFNSIGSSTILDSSAFKKVQSSSKINTANLFNTPEDFTLRYNKLHNLYMSDLSLSDSLSYGIRRQHEYSSINSVINNGTTLLDPKSLDALFGTLIPEKTLPDSIGSSSSKPDMSLKGTIESSQNGDTRYRNLVRSEAVNETQCTNSSSQFKYSVPADLSTTGANFTGARIFTENFANSTLRSSALISGNLFWYNNASKSDLGFRSSKITKFNDLAVGNSIPTMVEYSEYDFLNWQTLELLEDAFWESTFSGYSQNEYESLLIDASTFYELRKKEKAFNIRNRSWNTNPSAITNPFFRDFLNTTNLTSLPLYSEDSFSNPALTPQSDFAGYGTDLESDTSEESYVSNKFVGYLHYINYLNTISTSAYSNHPLSYAQVLNSFRSNFDEPINSAELGSTFVGNGDNLTLFGDETLRSSNATRLRSTAKNSIVTFNALQKVFRSRFDEGRSNVRFQDLSNSYVKYPFLSDKRTRYEDLLGKNKESFFNVNSYKHELSPYYSSVNSVFSSLNTYFSNIPFLLSMQSDPSRYLWFDWQSRWTSIEIQPSSIARYSLMGIPYFSKKFDYSPSQNENLSDSETYLIRLGRARKNYMSNWALTPYLYNRLSNWYANNSFVATTYNTPSVSNLRVLLGASKNYWISGSEIAIKSLYTPSFSEVNTPNRSSWRPSSSVQGYNYRVSILAKILTKREYLYREYFLHKGYSTNLPNSLVASPKNSLLNEVKKSYNFYDPTSVSTEIQRDFFYETLVSAQVRNPSIILSNLGLNRVGDMIFYLWGSSNPSGLNSNHELLKNQFRPMRKGISNMIRLHATGAIAMPIEIRLHILASSRDIIHSWSIPSAGIKIDCVPGYSSHRVAIFLVSGIYWGQCMEICGRFHHWMPIIVYFMKRDLFFLWCTHFIHLSPKDFSLTANSREFTPRVRKVSFSGNWLL